jgi:hypothetical protein
MTHIPRQLNNIMRLNYRFFLLIFTISLIFFSCKTKHTVKTNWYRLYNFKKKSNLLIHTIDSSYIIYRLGQHNYEHFFISAYGSFKKIEILNKIYLIFKDSILNQPTVRIYTDSTKDTIIGAHDSMQIILVNNFLNPRHLKMYLLGYSDTIIINNYAGRIGNSSFQIKSGQYNRFYIEVPCPDPYILDYTLRSNVLNFDMNFNGIFYVKMESTYSSLNKEPSIDFFNNDTAIYSNQSIIDFRKPSMLMYKKVKRTQFNKFYKNKFVPKLNF